MKYLLLIFLSVILFSFKESAFNTFEVKQNRTCDTTGLSLSQWLDMTDRCPLRDTFSVEFCISEIYPKPNPIFTKGFKVIERCGGTTVAYLDKHYRVLYVSLVEKEGYGRGKM